MKKIVLLICSLLAMLNLSAQSVLGTFSNDDVEFFANGTTPRGKWTKDGYFLVGPSGPPAGTTFTPGITFAACAGDLALLGGTSQGHLFISADHEIRSSGGNGYEYGSSAYNSGYYASILMADQT